MERLGLAGRLSREGMLALLGVLLAIVAVTLPELGSDPWPFRPGIIEPRGILGPLVRAGGDEWDVGIARTACFAAGLFLAAVGALALRRRDWPAWSGVAVAVLVAVALMLPSTLLQVGLRDSTQPWFFTNDSTYQIELGGGLLLHGENPYGHDYSRSGMERFYSFDGTASDAVRRREVSLRHYAYFPGTAVVGAVWRLLPSPLDDYRLLVALATLGGLAAALAFRAPLGWRLAVGALIAANPIAVRSAWFGQNDAPSITLMILAFALATRGRARWAAAALAGAVLLKQFAVVAIPFLAIMLLKQELARAELKRVAGVFAAVLAVVGLPFLIADPGAFWDDTVKFGTGTYKIVGYGLSGILVRAGLIADRDGSYPFALFAVVLWLPITIWLGVVAHRAREQWVAPAGFAISILVLLYIGRTFNNYYLLWPMMGAAIAALVCAGERPRVTVMTSDQLSDGTSS
ncbi:MAG: glycosyltransferase 87 family protein [Thermoleophilaceae bacterium]